MLSKKIITVEQMGITAAEWLKYKITSTEGSLLQHPKVLFIHLYNTVIICVK
jgi:hypothetical protein